MFSSSILPEMKAGNVIFLVIKIINSSRRDVDRGYFWDMYGALLTRAPVVELADTLDSGSSALTGVEVRILSGVPLLLRKKRILRNSLLSCAPRFAPVRCLEVYHKATTPTGKNFKEIHSNYGILSIDGLRGLQIFDCSTKYQFLN